MGDFEELINASVDYATEPQPTNKRNVGRPNKNITKTSKQLKNDNNIQYRTINNPIIESVAGEVVDYKDTKQFLEVYQLTIDSVVEQYFIDHSENLKRPPHEWYAQLLYKCKEQLPKIDKNNIDVVGGVWEIYSKLMHDIKLFPTREAFTNLTGIYKQWIDKQVTPQWQDLKQKMLEECESALENQVAFNQNTQINKMFLLKSVYGYKEADTQKTVEVTHTIKKINDIPLFGIEDNTSH